MKTPFILLGLLAASLSFHALGADKVYKWKDANGITHFTDQPPPKGTQFDSVSMKSGAAVTEGTASVQTADPNSPEATAAAAATAKTNSDNARCAQAQARVTILEGKSEVKVERDGKPVTLDKDGRAQELGVARAVVTTLCASSPEKKS